MSNNEITVKQLILRLNEWIIFLLSKKKIIITVGIAGMLLGITYSLLSKKVYEAEMTFAMEEKAGGLGGYSSIASQFGIDLGKGSESGAFVGENIVELFKSRLIIESALLETAQFNEGKELLINRYIKSNELDKKLDAKDATKDIKYTEGRPRSEFSRGQDSVLHAICESIKKNDLSVGKIDKKLNIIKLQIKSADEEFAKHFCEVLTANVKDLYIDTKTQKARKNVDLLTKKADSVETLLHKEMYGAAVSMDQNLNPIRTELRVPYAQKQMNVEILTTVYGELLKNLEISKLALQKEEPIIQIIDRPIYPLNFKRPGKIKSGIIGGFLSGFICVLILVLRRQYLIIVSEDE
jgi:hypothetical protein